MKARVSEHDPFEIVIAAWEDEENFPWYEGITEIDLTEQEAEWVKEGIRYFNEVQKLLRKKKEEADKSEYRF